MKDTTNKDIVSITHLLNKTEAAVIQPLGNSNYNPWTPDEVDTLDKSEKTATYRNKVNTCRFFYKKDALSSTTLNKLVELGITDVYLTKANLTDNEFRVFEIIKPKLKEFAEIMALEYLLSGLVVPEVEFSSITKDQVKALNIKKYDTITLPTSMWLRDPGAITINATMLGPQVSYYIEIPEKLRSFIANGGVYSDNTEDKALYQRLLVLYPDFVQLVKSGATKVLLDNKLIFRRKPQTYDPYPIPYLEPALEALQHKRNLRRMDYSLASRVISAILLFRLGDKDFPLTEDNSDALTDLKNQVMWRDQQGKNVERIFQLFSNHTLDIKWIMPDVAALTNDSKYSDINQEIIFALGFPRILITGEAERSNTSDPEFAMMSPIRTMEDFRGHIVQVLQYVVDETARLNSFTHTPVVSFKPINLTAFADYIAALSQLYIGGNLSRTTYADVLGINWKDEMEQKKEENEILKKNELGEFAPQPFSNSPTVPNAGNNNNTNNKETGNTEQ